MTEQAFSVQVALLERDGDLAAVDELIEAVPAGGRVVAIEGGGSRRPSPDIQSYPLHELARDDGAWEQRTAPCGAVRTAYRRADQAASAS